MCYLNTEESLVCFSYNSGILKSTFFHFPRLFVRLFFFFSTIFFIKEMPRYIAESEHYYTVLTVDNIFS